MANLSYYNEHNSFAAAWLCELIKQGHIANGIVDTRSIEDIKPSELTEFTQCHFFAGIGVWSYALRSAGWPDDRAVWTGSCPCQPFSAAGKRGGTSDERHLWPAFFHLISQCQPPTIFGEQVASKDGFAWLDLVSSDLEGANYTVGALDSCAAGVGAPHIRQRLYFVGYSNCTGSQRRRIGRDGSNERAVRAPSMAGSVVNATSEQVGIPGCSRQSRTTNGFWSDADWIACIDGKARPVEPGTFPLAHGIAARVGKLRGYGNALVAPQAQAFIESAIECGI